jgi:hypothetical protein
MGDGGSAGDPQNYAQQTSTLLGKILRLDVDAPLMRSLPTIPSSMILPARRKFGRMGCATCGGLVLTVPMGIYTSGDVGQNTYEEIDYHAFGTPNGAQLPVGASMRAYIITRVAMTPLTW